MDLRNQIAGLTKLLVVPKASELRISVKPPSGSTGHLFVVQIEFGHQGKILQALGGNASFHLAAVKALGELGEGILATDLNLRSRSGIAGGFLKRQIELRAMSELVERDAFLHHYRKRAPLPFLGTRQVKAGATPLNVFEMQTASAQFFACLVSPGIQELEGCPYIHFGTAAGAASAREEVIEKAIEEYYSLDIFSKENGGEILGLYRHPEKQGSLPDQHLAASFDPRNIEIFTTLLGMSDALPRIVSAECDSSWTTERLKSPVRGFKFLRIQNPQLVPMHFGENEAPAGQPPLLHPFW